MHNCFAETGGGGLASHAYLRAFSELCQGNIDLICADLLKKDVVKALPALTINKIFYVPERTKFQKLFSVFNGHLNRYYSYSSIHLRKYGNEYDYIVFDHSSIAGPLMKHALKCRGKKVTIHHNYEKEYYSDNANSLNKILFLHHVINCERKSYLHSDYNLFLTNEDKIKFTEVYGLNYAVNAVIGAFEFQDYKRVDVLESTKHENIVFAITGSLCNYQTTDAIRYFFAELYQFLPKDSRVIVAGRNPSKIVINLCSEHENVTLIPSPEDMNKVIGEADIYICATRIGGGLKLRVMDGLKNGLPVITHKCSARGFDIFHGQNFFVSYNDNSSFAKGLTKMIDLVQKEDFSRHKIQDLYKAGFSYEAGFNRLKTILLNNSSNYSYIKL